MVPVTPPSPPFQSLLFTGLLLSSCPHTLFTIGSEVTLVKSITVIMELSIPNLPLFLTALPTYSIFIIAPSALLLLFLVILLADSARRSKINLPGPTGWPLIGIGLDLPARPRKMLDTYRRKYGDAFKMRLGWYDWVFFNSPEGVKEVFDKQVGS